MMTNTEYNPKLLEQWSMDVNDIQELEELLQSYLHRYDTLFVSKKQRSHFSTFVKGLLSSLDRKSIEPIALHFLGEKAVRSLQQFFTRSPMDEQRFRDIYQSMLAEQINSSNAMLSVDDSSFVKKGLILSVSKGSIAADWANAKTVRSEYFLHMLVISVMVW